MRNPGVLWTILVLHIKQTIFDSFVLFALVVQPIIVALLAIYMLQGTEGFQAIYVIVGSGLTGLWSGTIFLASRGVDFERWCGTLEQIIASPTSLAVVVTGKGLADMVLSLASMFISYPLAAFIFGFRITISDPLLFVISLVLTMVALTSMALLLSPLFSLNPGSSTWSNPLEFLVYALCGFLFPIALLPAFLTPLSYLLPPYWGARALHLSSSGGGSLQEILTSWGFLVLSSVLCCVVAAWLFRVMLRRAQVHATLTVQ